MILVFRVSLMKNGEEIVSVGGAMEPSAKNMGISASNSVLLDLARVCDNSDIYLRFHNISASPG